MIYDKVFENALESYVDKSELIYVRLFKEDK